MGQRYRAYYPRDDSAQTDGDAGFIGVRAKGEPDQLPPGYVHDALNLSFDNHTARTRLGSRTPASFMAAGLTGPLYGAEIFSDPNELEWLLLVAADGIWRMRDGCTARKVPAPAPVTSRVQFAQTFGSMLAFRGSTLTPWGWDGDVRHAFAEISEADLADGTVPIPNGPDRAGLKPVVVNSRLIVPHGRNFAGVSDILDYTRYDDALSDFYLGGSNDHLMVALYPYQGSNLIVFLDQSIQLFSGLSGDLSGAALTPINDKLGCCAAETVQMLGADVLFLSTTGVYRLKQVIQDLIQAAPMPVSEPIEPIIKRITWTAVAGATAAVIGRYYVLAVPLDRSTVNNTMLVYDTVADAWHGIHQLPSGVQIDALRVTDYQGEKRLYAIDFATAHVHLLYEGRHDVIGSTRHDIRTSVELRRDAFGPTATPLGAAPFNNGEAIAQKRFVRGRVVVRGWAPSFSVDVKPEGVNLSRTVRTAVAYDRTLYKSHGAPAYDPSNAGDNHGQPYREDYSVDVGTPFDPGQNGIDFSLEQTHTEPLSVRSQNRGASIVVENTAGTLILLAAELEGATANRGGRPR